MWSKIADEFPSHPKIAEVGPLGAWLQVQAICYCSRYLTDGRFSESVAVQLVSSLGVPFQAAFKKDKSKAYVFTACAASGMQGADLHELDWIPVMVNAGLWDVTEAGFEVHDYLKYNPSRAEVTAERAARSQAGKAGADSRWHGKRHGNSHDKCHNDGKSHGTCDGKQMAKSCPVPVPVPEGKNGKGTDSGIPGPRPEPQPPPPGAPAATPPAAPAGYQPATGNTVTPGSSSNDSPSPQLLKDQAARRKEHAAETARAAQPLKNPDDPDF